jgi:hypothetical protein
MIEIRKDIRGQRIDQRAFPIGILPVGAVVARSRMIQEVHVDSGSARGEIPPGDSTLIGMTVPRLRAIEAAHRLSKKAMFSVIGLRPERQL